MKRPPRLAARTLAITFTMVAAILSIVFIVLTVEARDRVRAAEGEQLQVSERVFRAFETRRQHDQLAAIATLAENPTLKAALDTYFSESRFANIEPEQETALRGTVTLELEKLSALMAADALAILDMNGRVFAAAGIARKSWTSGARVEIAGAGRQSFQSVAILDRQAFLVFGAGLRLHDREVGTLVIATSLDTNYARDLAALSNAGVVITLEDRVIASTVPARVTADLASAFDGVRETATLNGEEYAIRMLQAAGPARIYTLTSIDSAARAATRDALVALGTVALGGFVLAGLGSFWLARAVTRPINRVASEIATMTAARDFARTLEPTGTSRELDDLAAAFNHLMGGLATAVADTRAAYVGAIRALAAALDARDPYTAGHSERVSAISVLIARQMALTEAEVDVIRLGALLHDIGKIGVADEILRKPGPLSAEEFDQIRRHPGLGARILRQVPFLAPHIPIVELHHERPDGKGYPFGLRGDNIPLDARIVHVADAFDAMTSARAYRPARGASFAVAELRRYSGQQFDPATVDALCAALSSAPSIDEPQLQQLLGRQLSA